MIKITAEPTTRGPRHQPRAAPNGVLNVNGALNGGAPLAAMALALPRHQPLPGPMPVAHPPATEPPSRAVSRLAALGERPSGVTAVTTVGALLANLPGTATADMGACLEDLCHDLGRCFARPDGPRLNCTCAAQQLPTGTVITLGLIADLLLTNAYTFGFAPPASGRIAVSFAALESSFELTIEDSGLRCPCIIQGGITQGGITQGGIAQSRADAVTTARLLVGELGGRLETPAVVGGSRCIVTLPRQRNRLSS